MKIFLFNLHINCNIKENKKKKLNLNDEYISLVNVYTCLL